MQQMTRAFSRQVAEYMLNATTYLATLQKEEAWFAFPARMTLLHMQFICRQLVLQCNATQRNRNSILMCVTHFYGCLATLDNLDND